MNSECPIDSPKCLRMHIYIYIVAKKNEKETKNQN